MRGAYADYFHFRIRDIVSDVSDHTAGRYNTIDCNYFAFC